MTAIVTTPILVAYDDALEKFRKSLPAKDLKQLQSPVRPEELVLQLERWESRAKTNRAVSAVLNGVARIKRFNECVDQLAQGLPHPASLVWGSIKFVLTVGSLLNKHQFGELG